MHDQRVRVEGLDARCEAVLTVGTACGHREQAGGLVYDEEVGVEVEDGGDGYARLV
jgi:hypothetical protein